MGKSNKPYNMNFNSLILFARCNAGSHNLNELDNWL